MGSSIRQSAPPAAYPPVPLPTMRRLWRLAVQIVLPSVLAIAAILAALPRARAAAEQSPVDVRSAEERSGALLLRRDDRFIEVPLGATDVRLALRKAG